MLASISFWFTSDVNIDFLSINLSFHRLIMQEAVYGEQLSLDAIKPEILKELDAELDFGCHCSHFVTSAVF